MEKRILRLDDPGNLPDRLRGAVVAVGNFDGVHRGHQAVLAVALDKARESGVPAIAMTFEPHPRTVFNPDAPVFRLTPAHLRARILEALGFDAVVEQRFDRAFAATEPEHFVATILVGNLGISQAVTGYDFHFGKNRGGTPAFLADAGNRHGFGVTAVDAFADEGGQTISSSRVRDALARGDVAEAAALLGYRPVFEAEVTRGKQLGRTLGYPTANMALPPETTLAHGIYAVRFRRQDGTFHDGVASFGRRPTVDKDGAPLLETFVFGFDGDLYGETCAVSLIAWLRGEEKFDGLDALVAQMRKDEAEARALLSALAPLSPPDAVLTFGHGD